LLTPSFYLINSYVPQAIAVDGTFMLILATAPFMNPLNPS